MSVEYEIDNYGHIYKNGERIGRIRNFPSVLNVPSADDIAEAIERRAEKRKKIEYYEGHIQATHGIFMNAYLEAVRTGDKARESNAIQGMMQMQRARRTLYGVHEE